MEKKEIFRFKINKSIAYYKKEINKIIFTKYINISNIEIIIII